MPGALIARPERARSGGVDQELPGSKERNRTQNVQTQKAQRPRYRGQHERRKTRPPRAVDALKAVDETFGSTRSFLGYWGGSKRIKKI